MNKKHSVLKRIIASLLVIVMIATAVDFTVLAEFPPTKKQKAVDQSEGNPSAGTYSRSLTSWSSEASSYADTTGIIWDGGYMIKLMSVTNEVTNSTQLQSIKESTGANECQVATAYASLCEFPGYFSSNMDVINECGLFYRKIGQFTYGSADISNIHYVSGSQYATEGVFQHVYDATNASAAGSGWTPTDIVTSAILGNTEMYNNFILGKLTADEVISMGSNWEASYANLASLFVDPGALKNALNGSWTEDKDTYKLRLLDLLLSVYSFCGSQSEDKELINTYLKTLNGDGANEFIVPYVCAVAIYDNKAGGPYASSLPDYISMALNGNCISMSEAVSLDKYSTMTGGTTNDSRTTEWYIGLTGNASKSDLKHCQTNSWFGQMVGLWFTSNEPAAHYNQANTELAFSVQPANLYGDNTGSIGYTYLALGGDGTPTKTETYPDLIDDTDGPEAWPFKFRLTASTETPVVELGTQVEAKLSINLKSSMAGKMQSYIAELGNPDVTVEYRLEVMKGTGTSSVLIDEQSLPPGGSVSGSTATWSGISWKDWEPYFKGRKLMTATDSGIVINKSTKNKYYATVTFDFPDGTEIKFLAAGAIVDDSKPFEAADIVSWGPEDDSIVHYYSAIGKEDIDDNYVEIKEGAPGSETFEAMAGVPTTQNLYS